MATEKSLQILTTNKGTQIYTDKGTGADTDLAVFIPDIPEGYYMVGHFGQPNHQTQMNGTVPVIKPIDPTAVAPPYNFEAMYDDRGSGGDQDVTLWRVIAPTGYTALGDIVNIGYNFPPDSIKNLYRCVRSDLVKQGEIDRSVWTDKGSGANQNGSVWYVQPSAEEGGITGYFKVQKDYNPPNVIMYAKCLV